MGTPTNAAQTGAISAVTTTIARGLFTGVLPLPPLCDGPLAARARAGFLTVSLRHAAVKAESPDRRAASISIAPP